MPPRRRASDDTGDPLDDDFDTLRVRPQTDESYGQPIYIPGRGQVPNTIIDASFVETTDAPTTPAAPPLQPPVLPTVPPFETVPTTRRIGRRRRNDWTALVVALVISTVVMAACCLAGLALFSTTNPGN
jgi:hypothetical protein